VIDRLTLPSTLRPGDAPLVVRRAAAVDLDSIMRLLSDDPISAGRGDTASDDDRDAYATALDRIIADPGNDIVVVTGSDGAVVGTLQLTVIPGMARRGSSRLLVEAVRVASTVRSSGIGGALMRWVTETPLVQLTSDAARTDAHRFYTRLGFVDSHVGFKYSVPLPARTPR
jgi:GNAT superfamily N-acetyltransferase